MGVLLSYMRADIGTAGLRPFVYEINEFPYVNEEATAVRLCCRCCRDLFRMITTNRRWPRRCAKSRNERTDGNAYAATADSFWVEIAGTIHTRRDGTNNTMTNIVRRSALSSQTPTLETPVVNGPLRALDTPMDFKRWHTSTTWLQILPPNYATIPGVDVRVGQQRRWTWRMGSCRRSMRSMSCIFHTRARVGRTTQTPSGHVPLPSGHRGDSRGVSCAHSG